MIRLLRFTPDSQHVLLLRKSDQTNQEELLVDGQSFGQFDDIRNLFVSPDSKAVGFLAVKNGKAALMLKAVPGAQIDPAIATMWEQTAGNITEEYKWGSFAGTFGDTYRSVAYLADGKAFFVLRDGHWEVRPKDTEWSIHPPLRLLPGDHVLAFESDQNGMKPIIDGATLEKPLRDLTYGFRLSKPDLLNFTGPDSFWYVGRDTYSKPVRVVVTMRPSGAERP